MQSRQSFFKPAPKFLAVLVPVLLAACGGDRSASDAAKLDAMELTADQRAVAGALVEGFRSETGEGSLSEAEIERAACYAREVDMPAAFADVHALYLADYATIDQNYYAWFKEKGVSMDDALDISERVKAGFEACMVG